MSIEQLKELIKDREERLRISQSELDGLKMLLADMVYEEGPEE